MNLSVNKLGAAIAALGALVCVTMLATGLLMQFGVIPRIAINPPLAAFSGPLIIVFGIVLYESGK